MQRLDRRFGRRGLNVALGLAVIWFAPFLRRTARTSHLAATLLCEGKFALN
jgi:hypothetical protein